MHSSSVGPSPFRALSTAIAACFRTSSTSSPSTVTPGIPYDSALLLIFFNFVATFPGVNWAHPLFSQQKTTGRFHKAARFRDS